MQSGSKGTRLEHRDAPPMMVRRLRAEDGPALERLARSCDGEDLRLRFF